MEELEKKLKELLLAHGEEWNSGFYDLGCDEADKVADFFNNGGLELHNDDTREHCAVTFVALADGGVDIGCWVWKYGEDFDADAEWHVLDPNCFYDWELQKICDKIVEIYGNRTDA